MHDLHFYCKQQNTCTDRLDDDKLDHLCIYSPIYPFICMSVSISFFVNLCLQIIIIFFIKYDVSMQSEMKSCIKKEFISSSHHVWYFPVINYQHFIIFIKTKKYLHMLSANLTSNSPIS